MICYYHNGKTIVSDKNHAVLIPKGSSYYLHGYETGYFPVMNFLCDRDDLFDEFITIELKKPDVLVKKVRAAKENISSESVPRKINERVLRYTFDDFRNR